jgi:CRISPR/Cas system CMR-associated protein Cmr3 (group 5 of RAMP superfamily)
MESKINVAIENLKQAILFDMNELSERHRNTILELSELQQKYSKLIESEKQKIREDAIREFKES